MRPFLELNYAAAPNLVEIGWSAAEV